VTARVKEGVGRVHRSGHVPAVEVDDDPTAAPLPPIVADDAADEALRRLDDEEAPPVEIRNDIQLVELFAAIDPVPTLPLTAPYEIGLGVVVRRLARVSDQDLGSDANVRRVLRLLGDRLSVTVGPDGISVRGLVRTRHTPWGKLQRLTFTSRYDQVKGQLVAQVADDVAGRLLPVPVPGLTWLIRRIVGGVGNLYERRNLTPEELEALRAGLGHSLVAIQRRGMDIELAGALRLLMFFSLGMSTAPEVRGGGPGHRDRRPQQLTALKGVVGQLHHREASTGSGEGVELTSRCLLSRAQLSEGGLPGGLVDDRRDGNRLAAVLCGRWRHLGCSSRTARTAVRALLRTTAGQRTHRS